MISLTQSVSYNDVIGNPEHNVTKIKESLKKTIEINF